MLKEKKHQKVYKIISQSRGLLFLFTCHFVSQMIFFLIKF